MEISDYNIKFIINSINVSLVLYDRSVYWKTESGYKKTITCVIWIEKILIHFGRFSIEVF